MRKLRVSAKSVPLWVRREIIFAAAANLPQIWPQMRRKCNRKYCRKSASNRKPAGARNSSRVTADMGGKIIMLQAHLRRFIQSRKYGVILCKPIQ